MNRAYGQAGLSPHSIGLIDAHGTATPVGDATEIEAMRRVFGVNGESDSGPSAFRQAKCALGTIKSMIGHPIPAAGAAAVIKCALALHHKVLPPTLHAEAANPMLAGTPFYLNGETRPWIHAGPEPRRAAVSAFGFGGINAHAILEEYLGE
jgi:acyl transferase domain-containing protein